MLSYVLTVALLGLLALVACQSSPAPRVPAPRVPAPRRPERPAELVAELVAACRASARSARPCGVVLVLPAPRSARLSGVAA